MGLGNETQVADGDAVLYLESVLWLEKGWRSFSRTGHTLYAGAELLAEPAESGRWVMDTRAAVVGYKLSTYLPDWYNLNVRLRVPVDGTLAGLQLKLDPLLYRKTWNTFAVWDRNRFTLTPAAIEYSHFLKLIDLTPDLEFPIAMYAGDELRVRWSFEDTAVDRVRNDFIVGLASNAADWLHLGVEAMYHLDTNEGASAFVVEVYLELYFEVFFDNTIGSKARGAHEEERT